jgi:subtilase family serine protease
VASLAACRGGSVDGEADLVPVPQINSLSPVTVSFCLRVDDGEGLEVTVRNQGTGTASDSPVRVVFSGVPPPTPPNTMTGGQLDPGEIAILTFQIPLGCFGADCGFTILVDPDDVITESNEGNNTADGDCIG